MYTPVFLILLYIFVPQFVLTEEPPEPNNNKGGCQIKEITEASYKAYQKVSFGDNETEKIVFYSDYSDKLEIEKCMRATDPNLLDYISVSKTDKQFQISTTAKMKNFDEAVPRQSSDIVTSYVTCTLQCPKDETVVKFRFDIKDINEHSPTFNEKEYEYKVPTPLMPGSDLTRYGIPIIAEDLDFSNNNITFTIEPDEFEIKALPTTPNAKTYTAQFSARSVMFLKDSKEYTLTATDDGKDPGPLSNTVKIKLTADSKTSIDTPTFSSPSSSYTLNYQIKDGKPILVGDAIKIESSKLDDIKITVSGEQKEKFHANLKKDTKEIELTAVSPITTLLPYLSLTISIKTDLTTSALVVIHMPEVTLEFDKHLITGNYDPNTKVLSMFENLTLNSIGGDAKLDLTGDEHEYFDLKLDKEKKTYSVVIKAGKSIPEEDLKGKKSLALTIVASLGEKTDKASVIIYLPVNTLKFTNPLYTGTYDAEKKVVTVDKVPIAFANKVDAVTITVDDKYNKFFGITYDTKKQIGEVKILEVLSPEVLSAGKPLVIQITATDSEKNEAKAVLEVSLPKVNGPVFQKSYYEVVYPKDGKGPISADFGFQPETDPTKVKIKLQDSEYEKNFTIEYKDKKWQINIISPLQSDTFKNFRELKIPIAATETGITLIGHAVLIVNLPEIKGPEFTESVYIVEYPKDGKGPIKFQNGLKFKNDVVVDSIVLSDYKGNFSINKDGDAWQIKIDTPLDLEQLKDKTELLLTMTAKEKDNSETGTATLIIKLPQTNNGGPKFKEPYYQITYPKDAKAGTSIAFSQLAFENVDESKITVSVGSGYQDNFHIKRTEDTKKWVMEISKPIDQKILDNSTELLITMTIEEDGKMTTGSSVLALELPQAIAFQRAFYVAVYPKTGAAKLQFDHPIEFANSPSYSKDMKIIVKDYSENFEVIYDDKTKNWVLNVKKPLEKATINSKNELVTVMEAQSNDLKAGTATLVVQIQKEITTTPKFTKSLYEADYPKNGNDNIKLDLLDFDNVEDKTKIAVSVLGYEENFKFVMDPSTFKWHIEIVKPLENENLQEKPDLRLIMEAVVDGLKTESVLILNLPSKSGKDLPAFKNDYYTAEYPKNPTIGEEIDVQKPIAFSNIADVEKVNIELEVYKENFDVIYNTTEKKFVLKIKKKLDTKSRELVTTIYATNGSESDKGKAVLVVRLPSADTDEGPQFSDPFYSGDYKKDKDKYVVELKKKIVVTSQLDINKISVTLLDDPGFKANTYFELKKQTDGYTIDVKKNLPDKILLTRYLTIKVQAKLNGKKSTATLIINLPGQDGSQLAKFGQVLYKGQYLDKKLTYESINVTTELDDSKVNVKLAEVSDKYKKFFDIKYKDKNVTITVIGTMPSEDVVSLVLDLIVDAKIQSSAVLEITVEGSHKQSIQFDKIYYNGEYNVKDGKLTQVDEITLKTDIAEEKISVKLVDEPDFVDNFGITVKDKIVSITLKKPLPADKLKARHILTFKIQANSDDLNVSAVLNIKIIDPTVDAAVQFDKPIYDAQLNLTDGKKIFSCDPITIKQLLPSSGEVELTVADDYKNFFNVQLKDKQVEIALKPTADVGNLKKLNIAVELMATVKGTSASTFSVLNVVIYAHHPSPDNPSDFNKTPYIVAISLLSVSLVVLTACAIAFYYFKIRRKDYTEVDEELWKVRFDKNSMSKSPDGRKGSALEGRRPTGYVFNSPEENDSPRESNTDAPDRRKSVIFDSIVEKREIDSVLDDDNDKEKMNGTN